jgi:hypothetical protein
MIRQALFIAFVLCVSAVAQTTKPETVTRVYDVRDMLVSIPNFPYMGEIGLPQMHDRRGGGGGGGGSMFVGSDGQAKSAEQLDKERFDKVQEIIGVIQTTVEPDTWSEGQPGNVRELSGQLIITQTPRAHELVGSLMKQLRENTGMVRVQADWVVLTPGSRGRACHAC